MGIADRLSKRRSRCGVTIDSDDQDGSVKVIIRQRGKDSDTESRRDSSRDSNRGSIPLPYASQYGDSHVGDSSLRSTHQSHRDSHNGHHRDSRRESSRALVPVQENKVTEFERPGHRDGSSHRSEHRHHGRDHNRRSRSERRDKDISELKRLVARISRDEKRRLAKAVVRGAVLDELADDALDTLIWRNYVPSYTSGLIVGGVGLSLVSDVYGGYYGGYYSGRYWI